MKHTTRLFAPLLAALFFAAGAHAQDTAQQPAGNRQMLPQEALSLAIDQTMELKVPFVIADVKSSSDCVKVSNTTECAFQVVGVQVGTCAVTVSSDTLAKVFKINVTGSALPLFRELSALLSDVPEVAVTMRDNAITLRGEISSVAHWNRFRRVTAPYASRISNFVVFQPSPEMFDALKKDLTGAGFKLADTISPDAPGQLKLEVDTGTLTISGYVLCDHDIKTIQDLLDAQKWLSPKWNGNFFEAKTNLTVSYTQLDIGIVFVGVTRTQLEHLGNTSAKKGTVLSWNVISWFSSLAHAAYPGSSNQSSGHGTYTSINTNLEGTLIMLNKNGISDFRDAGHITITNNSTEYGSYENGGTLNVKVAGTENADLKPIEFGLKLKVRGGLVRSDTVRLSLDLEKSLAPVKSDEDYFQRSTKSRTELLCSLGNTAVIAGQKELSYSDNGPSGYSFLRHLPVISWFFAETGTESEQLQMLILVCPQLSTQKATMTSTPSQDTATTETDVSERVKMREKETLLQETLPAKRKIFTK